MYRHGMFRILYYFIDNLLFNIELPFKKVDHIPIADGDLCLRCAISKQDWQKVLLRSPLRVQFIRGLRCISNKRL